MTKPDTMHSKTAEFSCLEEMVRAADTALRASDITSAICGLATVERHCDALARQLGAGLLRSSLTCSLMGGTEDYMNRVALSCRQAWQLALDRLKAIRIATAELRQIAMLRQAERRLGNDDAHTAIDALPSVHIRAHRKLNERTAAALHALADARPELAKAVGGAIQALSLRYLHTITHPDMGRCVDVVGSTGSDYLMALDYDRGAVHRVSAKGDYQGILTKGLSRPQAFFLNSGGLWICDFGSARLLGLNETGDVAAAIDLNVIIPGDCRHPRSCVEVEGQLAVLTFDNSFTRQGLCRFRPDNPTASFEEIDISGTERLISLKAWGSCLVAQDSVTGHLYVLDSHKPCLRRLEVGPLPRPARDFAATAACRYVISADALVGLASSGRTLFSVDLPELVGTGCNASRISAQVISEGKTRIAVCDTALKGIHIFLTRTPETRP